MNWNAFFNVLMILVSIALMATVLLQNRSSGAGSIFGQQTTVFRTRRGLERILYRATIALSVVFVITALVSVRLHQPTFAVPDLQFPGSSLPVAPAPDASAPAPSGDGTQPSAAPADGSSAAPSGDGQAQPSGDAPAPAQPPAAAPATP